MAVIGINYEEGNAFTYKSVYLFPMSGKQEIFDSGDLERDWYKAKKFWMKDYVNDPMFSHSSSVDHFMMDGGDEFYDSAYLVAKEDGNGAELLYLTDNGQKLDDATIEKIIDKGWEFFVKKGTRPTFEELKERFKD